MTSSNSSNIYDNISDLHSNTEPSVDEVMACGFDQVFVDAKWSTIEKSVELDDWMKEVAITLPFLYSIALPNCNKLEKKRKIKLVVALVMSALYNNGCDFEHFGEKKPDAQLDDKVPIINAGVYSYLFDIIQTKLRYKRSNMKRDTAKKTDSESDLMDNSSKENKEASTVKSPVTLNTPIIFPPAVDNRRRTPLSGKSLKSSSSNQNSSLLSDSAESDLRKRKIEEVEEEEEFLSTDEEEKPKNAKLKTKQASPRSIRIPKGSVMEAATESAYELSQEHDKDKAATTKKPKKVAASPKTKKTKK